MSKREKGRGRGRGKISPPNPSVGAENDFPPFERNGTPSPSSSDSSSTSPQGRGRGRRVQEPDRPEEVQSLPFKKQAGVNGTLSGLGAENKSLAGSNHSGKKTGLQLAKRPGFGTAGSPIDLVTNYYQLQYKPQNVYHYDVEINSLDQIKKYGKVVRKMTDAEAAEARISRIEHQLDKNVGRLRCREIFAQLVKNRALQSFSPVFDGAKNIYTAKPLPFFSAENPKVRIEIEVESAGRSRKYEVIIQPVQKSSGTNVVDFNVLKQTYEGKSELIHVLNNIMNHRNPDTSQIQLGRSFFYLQQKTTDLGEGIEIWYGYNQNIHMTQKGLAIVLNLSAKAFHKEGPAIDYINKVLNKDITRSEPLKHYEIRKIEESLRGVKVGVTHLKYQRKYVIHGVSKVPASELRMNFEGRDISIADYYQRKYERLKYPFLHCFFMKSGNTTYIPFENCKILPGQPKLGKMSPSATAKMIRQTAIVPTERFKAIQEHATNVKRESGQKMSQYQLLMDLQPFRVRGRVIDAPALKYASSESFPDKRGVWRMENGMKFKVSIDIQSWVLLCFAERCTVQALQMFSDTLTKTGRKVGLNFGKFLGIKKLGRRDTVEQALKMAEGSKASFAMIVLSRMDTIHNYDEIKFIADFRLGFVTQCIDSAVLDRVNDQIATNLCLKINTKLGGVNHILYNRPKAFSRPVIVFGADAVHAMRDSPCPSIASLVGSLDAYPSRYKVECRVQENKNSNKQSQEVILDLKEMVMSILKAFYHHVKGKYPESILFFRDGVSEGQFKTVRDEEVSAVQEASKEVVGHIVPMTFVVVQKRHQTRLRPQNPSQGVNKTGNIPPGTTVDNDITHPDHFDYFLNSHEGIQGTSKPAHYTVLYDDNNFDADELQSLSYHLCYTYSKCNRSISIPAPVMYADLACYRAKKYADFHLQKEREKASGSSDSKIRLPDHVRRAINTMGDFKTSMFFV